MSLKDLELLRHEVLNDESRELIAEVIKCYEAGAYRASLVSLWVTVVADLTAKIRYLAESGDGESKEIIRIFDKAVRDKNVAKVQQHEREILENAEKKLGILLPREREELERLNQDRNLCAHPGYLEGNVLFVPDAELVRVHIVATVRGVLSKQPLAGKRFLEILIREIGGVSWPDERQYFFNRFYNKVRESVQRNMTVLLIKFSVRPPDDNDIIARRALNAALLIAENSPGLFEECLGSVLDTREKTGNLSDLELIRVSGAYGNKMMLWEVMPDTAKQRLITILDSCDLDSLIKGRFFVSGMIQETNLKSKYEEIVAKLNYEQMVSVLEQSMDCTLLIPGVLNLVGNSRSFRSAEDRLRLLEQCSSKLGKQDIQKLLSAIQNNSYDQIRRAGDTEAILISIYSASTLTDETCAEWCALAEWLHDEGHERGEESYLYNDLLKHVGGKECGECSY